MPRIIFFGTSDFAVPSLNALVNDGRFEIIGVVTQPDRPVGRHAELTAPPIKQAAKELGITTILQPEKIKDESFTSWIKELGPTCDVFVVVSYGKILPQWLLDLPKHGVVNVHGSLLPRWRGASPIQAAILNGDAESGATIMKLDALMDHGPVIATVTTPIHPEDTGGTLHDRIAQLGAEILPMTLTGLIDGSIQPEEQDHDAATSCGILTRDHGKIDWSTPASDISRMIRAYHPWPGTWTMYAGKRLKITKATVIMGDDAFTPGKCLVFEHQPAVACGDGCVLVLTEVQREGKAASSGHEFLRGVPGWENGQLPS
jgi:methionyl-tRNA formyltransferase